MANNLLTLDEITSIYETLTAEHKQNLEEYGVVLPPLTSGKSGMNKRALQLILLRHRYRQPVGKNELADFVKTFDPTASGDQQARHLAYAGWDVRCSGKSGDKFEGKPLKNGDYVLASVEHPSSKFLTARLKRLGRVEAQDWDGLVAAYGGRCATCGRESEKLEKGHKDPRLPAALENIIPMCGECNNHAGDAFVFDDAGRIVGLASPRIVLASDADVRYQIYLKLLAEFKSRKK